MTSLVEDLGDKALEATTETIDQLILSANSEVALCVTDYWLNTLWQLVFQLIEYLDGAEVPLDYVRSFAYGIESEGYGADPHTATAVCQVNDQGVWVVKDPVPLPFN